jgi:hypothetical protein
VTVFISYSRLSVEYARTLADDLASLDVEVWYDQKLTGGQEWWDKILEQVRGRNVFVFVVSATALKSEACQSELGYALALGKAVLPVLSDDTSLNVAPAELRELQAIDYRARDKAALLALRKALRELPPPAPLPTTLPQEPAMPVPYLARLADRSKQPQLALDAQRAVVMDLAEYIRSDHEDAETARELLRAFAKRRDLIVAVARQIDDLPDDVLTQERAWWKLWRSRGDRAARQRSGARVYAAVGLELALFLALAWLAAYWVNVASERPMAAGTCFALVVGVGIARAARALRGAF